MLRDKVFRLSFGHLACIALVYLVSFGVFSLVSVPFWDDWVLISHNPDGLWEMFSQLGRRDQFFIIAPFASMANPIVWASASFICWGLVAMCTYFVLKGVGWPPTHAFWATLLGAAAPLNQARFALAVLPYSVSAAIFSIAMLLLVLSVQCRSMVFRIAAATCLLLSFSTNSFLTLAPVTIVVTYLALRKFRPTDGVLKTCQSTLFRFELFLLPILYWLVKSVLQPVYGQYANYNQFRMDVFSAVFESVRVLLAQIRQFPLLFPTQSHAQEAAFVASLTLVFLAVLVRFLQLDTSIKDDTATRRWITAGGLVLVAISAIFPYAIVGLRPSFIELWDTRHQTTLAIIAGPFVFASIFAIIPRRAVATSCAAVLFVFISADISVSRQLMADISDMYATIYSKKISELPKNTLVAVYDNNKDSRMMNRDYRFYEISMMLSKHGNDRSVMAVSAYGIVNPRTKEISLPGSDSIKTYLSEICSEYRKFPEYGFGEIDKLPSYTEIYIVANYPPSNYFEGLISTIGFFVNRQEAIESSLEKLNVSIKNYQDVKLSCS